MNTLHRFKAWITLLPNLLLCLGVAGDAIAQESPSTPLASEAPALQVTVNSPLDGPIQPDEALTLREALELVNGTLPVAALSEVERGLVQPAVGGSQIGFALPPTDTVIELQALLPAITAANTTLDGTTQSGYGDRDGVYPGIPVPVVSLTPAPGVEVLRGLTVAADEVTIRGLALYGFTAINHRATQTTPPTDIFISTAPPQVDAAPGAPPVTYFDTRQSETAVQGTVLELNWLGITPDERIPPVRSAFGVSVFNGVNTLIQQNRIQHHEGSGVITAVRAEGMTLADNVIVGNGVAGMPDAVRLEGKVAGANIQTNLICGNDGSGLYLFKPEGATTIQGNDIRFNGRRFERAAVYLMGSGHQVTDNAIGYQPGPGVAVAAYPQSDRNLILNNQFAALDGLSIDLVTQQNAGVTALQKADGPNPPRNSRFRRLETANGAINAPTFPTYTFTRENGQAVLTGQADPGSEVDFYRVIEEDGVYGPLANPLGTVTADAEGRFSWTWTNPEGLWVSAIATDPTYGTSEPSPAVQVPAADGTLPERVAQQPYVATCEPPAPEPPPVAATPPIPEPLQLRVPRNIHFALDRSNISAESAAVLNQIATVLLEYPFLVVELRGHTDPRASTSYNQALSERRSRAAREYLQRKGIAPERMRIVPLGESQRATSGSNRVDYARDRRVEFIFQDTRGLDIIFESQETDLQVE
ncbi:MAG TPA: OmpA family protein [Trichocoleus sp.]